MNLPTIKQLQYFVALADAEHFGKAADACNVSQSALSMAIQQLEASLNARLVDRTQRNVTITSTGRDVATQARRILEEMDTLVEIASGQSEPLNGDLRLGIIPTIAPFLLPTALPKLRMHYPKLRLYLAEDQTQRLYDRLMNGDLDVLLLALPWPMAGVETTNLYKDPFCLAYRDGTQRIDPDNYSLSQLDADSILLLEDGHCLRDHALAACKIRDTDKVRRFAASSLLTLVEMVDADLGISYLPAMARNSQMLRNTNVKLHSLDDNSYRTIGLAWRKGSRRADEFRLLGDFLSARPSTKKYE